MSAVFPASGSSLRRDARVIGLVGVAHGTSHFFHLIVAPLFPWLKVHFGLSYAELGLLMTVLFTVSGIGQALAGFVVDRIGAFPVLVTGVALLALSALVLAAAPSYPVLLLGAAISGLGNAVFHPADFTLLNQRVSAARLPHAFSAHGLAGTLGWAVAPVVLAALAGLAGWRTALVGASALALSVLVALLLMRDALHDTVATRRERSSREAREAIPGATLAFLREPAVWVCFGFFFTMAMALGGIQSFAPAALQELYDAPLALAASAVTLFMLASAGGNIVGGFLAARNRRHDHVIAGSFVLAAAMSALLATGAVPLWLLAAPIAVMGFASGIAGPSRDLLVRAAAPRPATGRVYGVVYSGLDSGVAVAPPLFGAMMDNHHAGWLFAMIGVFQLLALVTALGVGRRAGRHSAAPHNA
ncbi:MAG: MFS transporter [Betaproteobacteria bacterium]